MALWTPTSKSSAQTFTPRTKSLQVQAAVDAEWTSGTTFTWDAIVNFNWSEEINNEWVALSKS